MPRTLRSLFQRELLLLLATIGLIVGAATYFYFMRATVLTIAVAPRDGTEPALIQAYADALVDARSGIRLKILSFDDVAESGKALQGGRADLAVVRPDVMTPTNGLTVLILRDQAMIIASPESAGIKEFASLAGKRLGIAAHRDADTKVIAQVLGYFGLALETGQERPQGASVGLLPVEDDQVAAAFREKRIDAFVSIIAPSAPKAIALVDKIKGVSRAGKVSFLQVADDGAVVERFPQLQAVTIPGGLFGGRPKLPEDDVKTIGASYRLMASSSLSRSVVSDLTQSLFELRASAAQATNAADYVKAPSYETTVAATSATIPNHPGALDYYERDQHGFFEKYGDTLYLLGAMLGGLASAAAWISERMSRLRRERIDDIMDRLLKIAEEAREMTDPKVIADKNVEIDSLAMDAVRYARDRDPDPGTIAALSIAIETARATVRDFKPEAAARTAVLSE